MFNPFCSDQLIRDLFDEIGLATHDEHFQTIMVVKMNVNRRNDHFMVVMLDVGQRSLNVLFVMIVNECDGAGNLFRAKFLPVFDEFVPDHVGNRLRSVVISLFPHHFVKLSQ